MLKKTVVAASKDYRWEEFVTKDPGGKCARLTNKPANDVPVVYLSLTFAQVGHFLYEDGTEEELDGILGVD
ncbi:MAG: hypothetical protein IPM93_01040 [Candidatus Obscuribacter sp.]|nr:hypothetical protein [Candidatus Obscuribacter sp.]